LERHRKSLTELQVHSGQQTSDDETDTDGTERELVIGLHSGYAGHGESCERVAPADQILLQEIAREMYTNR
jgi:hypothetical protein